MLEFIANDDLRKLLIHIGKLSPLVCQEGLGLLRHTLVRSRTVFSYLP